MRKRDKLYTANKWNRPLFADVDRENQNIFDGEYNSSMQIGIPINTGYNPQVNIPDKININGIIQQNAYNDYMNSSGNNWFDISKKNNPFSKQNVGTTMKGIGAGAAVAAGAVNTGDPRGLYDTLDPVYHLAGGRESGAGNAMSDAGVGLFNAGAQSGNPWLMLAGAGAKVLGGLTNAAFGLKTDKNRLNRINQNIADFNSSFGASSLDDIRGFGALANPEGIYKGGWFSGGKAKKKNEQTVNSFNNALSFAQRGQTNTVDNMWREKLHDEFADWYAFGGPLGTPMYGNTGMGAIDYGFMSDYLTAKNKQAENKNTASNPFAGVANNFFSDGGSIHIKHPGRLTELKKRTGKTEAELWAEGRPDVRKMITFARNARAWSKANGGKIHRNGVEVPNFFDFGGDMQTNSADFSTGLTHISAGGSHEESPYDGVQLGVDSEGKPNLVEEGEVVFNDYVFSDRIPIDDETKKKFHFPKKRDITYAEAAKKLEKEISERPNDPISKSSFNAQMQQLEEQQERQKQEMEAARAREAFEALSPEEQAGVMRYAQQQEQAAQEQAMQQEAMAQQAQMQQLSPEEIAMAEQQQMVPQEEMAYGGNLYPDGGAMNYLKGKYPQMSIDSLRKIATILEKRVTDSLTDKRTRKLTRSATEKDYSRAFSEYDSLNSDKRFNNWVNAGLSRDVAFDISYSKPPKSWGQSELDKWNAKRAELTKEPKRRTVYKNPLNGKTFNTKAEADADVKAYREAQRQQAASSKASKPTHQTFEDSRGWKHSTQEAAEAANARYAKQNQQNSTGSYVDDRGWKHSTQQAAEAANKRYAKQAAQTQQAAAPAAQKAAPAKEAVSATPTANRSVGNQAANNRGSNGRRLGADITSNDAINVGTYRGQGNQWDVYGKPGLWQYVNSALADYDLADSPEAQQEIAQRIVDELNGVQQSYWDNIVPTLGKSVQKKDKGVGSHQELYQERTGNAGFIGIDPITGQRIDLTDQAVVKPEGHNTTDTLVGGFVDERSGPQTWLRHLGASGDNLDDVVEELRRRGIDYSPYADWTVGNGDNTRQLYRASLLNSPNANGGIPEDATNFGDYNPDYEEEDTFEIVDENGNPTGVSASSAEAVSGVPGTTTLTNTNPVPKHKAEWMRYAGLFGPAVGLGMQMAGIGKPDYSSLDAAVNGSGNAYLADYQPIGNYLRYNPMDIWFEQNRLNANARATDRAILNSGSNQGAKAAALLANGYNTQTASGDLYRKGLEYNDALRQQVAGFNRGTDQFNAEAYNRTSQFNADALNRARQFNRGLAMQAAGQKLASDAGWYNGIYGNVAGIFKGLSELGRENAQYNWLSDLAADGVFGNLGTSYTGQRYIEDKNKKNKAAKGGKLKKKGLTF